MSPASVPTIEQKTRISQFDEESENCSVSSLRDQRSFSSISTPRPTIVSTSSVICSIVQLSNDIAKVHLTSGLPLVPKLDLIGQAASSHLAQVNVTVPVRLLNETNGRSVGTNEGEETESSFPSLPTVSVRLRLLQIHRQLAELTGDPSHFEAAIETAEAMIADGVGPDWLADEADEIRGLLESPQ